MPHHVDTAATRRDLLQLGEDIDKALANAVTTAVDAGYQDARGTALFNDRSGTLRGSIDKTEASGLGSLGTHQGAFFATAKYARYVENGTEPHGIAGRRGGTLRFVMNGTVVFRKSVWHPGTNQRPFMEHAAFVAELALEHAIESSIDRLVSK